MTNWTWSGGTADWYTVGDWIPDTSATATSPQAGDTATIASGLAQISAADVAAFGTLNGITLTLAAGLAATNETFGSLMLIDDPVGAIGRLALGGTSSFAGTIDVFGSLLVAANTLTNTGNILLESGSAALAIDATAPFINDGVLNAESGTLLVVGSLQGYGTVEIGASTTIGATDPGQILDFATQGSLTVLGTAGLGLIEDFSRGDTIDLTGIVANALRYDTVVGGLTLLENQTTVATLEFAGDRVSENIRLAPDGHGGSVLFAPIQTQWEGTAGDWYTGTLWSNGLPQPGGIAVITGGNPTISTADVATYGSLDNLLIELGSPGAPQPTLSAAGETFGPGVTLVPFPNASGGINAMVSLTGNTLFEGTLDGNERGGLLQLTDSGTLTNTGLIYADRQGITIGASVLVNDREISFYANHASLTQGSVVGTGNIEIGGGVTLTIASGVSVAATQNLNFEDGLGNLLSLTLANPGDFAAGIDGFVKGDTIALVGIVAATDSYDATAGILTLYGSTGTSPVATLDIGLGFQTGDITLASAGGSTTLTSKRATGDGADEALHGDQARATYGVTGAGITIGIISDSFNLHGGEATDIADGDLPANVNILREGTSGGTDEGRAMAELIHRIAPGATIDFYGPANVSDDAAAEASFAAGVTALAAAGANIIVDDLGYDFEPYFQLGGTIETAVQNVLNTGTTEYFSAAGNAGNNYYQGSYNALAVSLPGLAGTVMANDFGGGNPLQAINIDHDTAIDLVLEWNQPYAGIGGSAGAQNGLSMYLYNSANVIVASATGDAEAGDPLRELYYYNSGGAGVYRLALVWDQGSTAPGLFKYINESGTDVTFDDPLAGQGSGTSVGHESEPGADTTGAVDYLNTPAFGVSPPRLESYSSSGAGLFLFGADGQSLATPIIPGTPEFVSVDGDSTSVFDPFFGTSAAAPDAAAVAALMLQANPTLTNAQITTMLEESAISLGLPASEQGAGLIQADRAVALAEGACYLEGTCLATEAGETPIEQLRIGDRLRTASGELRPIRWIGRRRYDGRFAAANPDLQPIRIRRGAIDDGVPTRDLFVSSRHAMFIDGLLLAAELLVNGDSITRTTAVADITYLHVEFETHDVVLAEGAPSESFVDDDSRAMFQNAAEYGVLYPDATRRPARYCAPRPEDGAALEAVRRRLADRVRTREIETPGMLRGRVDLVARDRVAGWAQDAAAPDRPVRLRILDHGVAIGEVLADRYRDDLMVAGFGNGCCAFELIIPGGLAPEIRHVVTVQPVSDGQNLLNSPWILEPVASAVLPTDGISPCRGRIDLVTRERIAGWAQDVDAPDRPVALQILDNGVLIARVLANRHRPDLAASGIGGGRHSFDVRFPGLSPLSRHLIAIQREQDGADIAPPVVIEPADSFDTGLEQAVSRAVAATTERGEQARVLSFIAAQADRLRQLCADEEGDLEARSRYRQRHAMPNAPLVAPGPRALVIDDRLPVAGRDGGSAALLSHMRALQRLGYAVSFAASRMEPPSAALEAAGISHCTAPFYASVEDVLRRQAGCFDLVYLHRLEVAARYTALARSYSPRGKILYSVADLHHVRFARQAAVEGRADLLAASRTLRQGERMAAWSADVVVTHSAAEAGLLRQAMPAARIHVVPWDVPAAPVLAPFASRHDVAFIGFFGHAPNVDAANWLAEAVMPMVRQADPTINLLLVGSDMPDAIRRLAGPGIVPVGHVPDLQAGVFDRVRLTVAPMRYGAGVSSKVLESLAAGVPCAMSPFAAEGLALPPALQTLVGDDAASLAALICRLHADAAANRAASSAGQALIRTRHDTATVDASLAAALGVQVAGRVSIASTRSG